ncbi:MAG TPA: argininosuccinate lyase [Candidatus Wallbacteria bacterium]|nr:argininosuccinate lyase [Candidatus Wallbacteria bacterium]
MKRYSVYLLLAVVILLGASTFINAQEEKVAVVPPETTAADSINDFTLVNKTGYVISDIFVGPSKAEEWGEDILGKDVVLADGEEVLVKFHPKASVETYDIKVTYQVDNSSVVWYGYDLTKINKITIYYDHEKDKTSAKTE